MFVEYLFVLGMGGKVVSEIDIDFVVIECKIWLRFSSDRIEGGE